MIRYYTVSNGNRRGNVLVLTAFLMIVLLGMIAFAVDIGYLEVAKVELQRTADAAAMAAVLELKPTTGSVTSGLISSARDYAVNYAGSTSTNYNNVLNTNLTVDRNNSNSTSGDVVIGYLDTANPNATIDTSHPGLSNAVQVTVRRTAASGNGDVPLFFARALGINSERMQTSGTAALINNIGSFNAPKDGSDLGILPFALDQPTWSNMLSSGSDGNLYPQGTGSPGNRGTVDIGSAGNSTSDITRQILQGVSPSDMAALAADGRSLTFDSNGHIYLNGDTGISAGVKDELASIIGKPRIIPIFDAVTGPGNNANYEIVAFVGVKILDVKLNGKMSDKHVTIRPANVLTLGAKQSTTGSQTSWYVYSPAWLVR